MKIVRLIGVWIWDKVKWVAVKVWAECVRFKNKVVKWYWEL